MKIDKKKEHTANWIFDPERFLSEVFFTKIEKTSDVLSEHVVHFRGIIQLRHNQNKNYFENVNLAELEILNFF